MEEVYRRSLAGIVLAEGESVILCRHVSPVIADAARKIGATATDIPGLWNAPGHPELTTAQLMNIAATR